MLNTPISEQIRIVLFGLRNAGKSSLMNNIFKNYVSIVSDKPGTTTDPVTKSIELGSLGPVVFTDTGGVDDVDEVGALRVERTVEFLNISDVAILVTPINKEPEDTELLFVKNIIDSKKSFIVVLTFKDKEPNNKKIEWAKGFKHVIVNNKTGEGVEDLKKLIISFSNLLEFEIPPLEGIVREQDFVLLVVPIDLAAPKGRLILPQVETIRDALDKDCSVMIVKERELKYFYDSIGIKPKIVITDSQAFSKVAADIPPVQLLTSFSILFARKKGDLALFVKGIKRLNDIKPGSKILILEACHHHQQADDIGTVKIPRLFRQMVQSECHFEFARDLPPIEKLKEYSLVIQCGACMATRRKILYRLKILNENNIPSTNYGLFLAWANGLLPRALEPFPYEYNLYNEL